MDRARAIRLAEKWSQGYVCTLREGEAQEYHKLCLAALQEQEQRKQGCEYCKSLEKKYTDFKPGDLVARGVVEYTYWGDGAMRRTVEKFCPWCGRKLPEPPKEGAEG